MTAPFAVVPNGVDLEKFTVRGPVDRVLTRVELGIDEAPTAVCVGRLSPQKGQHLLLRAWPKVTARVPGAQLVLVGDGPDEAELRVRARSLEGVRFVGVRTDVPRWPGPSRCGSPVRRWPTWRGGVATSMCRSTGTRPRPPGPSVSCR